MKLTKDEETVFFAICKFVRKMQNMGLQADMKESNKLDHIKVPFTQKKKLAIVFSLQDKGLVKTYKPYNRLYRYIEISEDGEQYIKFLKDRKK